MLFSVNLNMNEPWVYICLLCLEPPSHLPPHPTPLGWYRASEFHETYSKFPLAIYFTYGSISFHVTLSIHLTISSPSPQLTRAIYLCFILTFFSQIMLKLSYSIESLMCVCYSFSRVKLFATLWTVARQALLSM